MITFRIADLKVLRYIADGHTTLSPTVIDNLTYELEPGKEYKLSVNVASNTAFDSIGMDILWDDDAVVIKKVNDLPMKEEGDLFNDVARSVNTNLFPEDKRMYVSNIANRGQVPNTNGTFTVVSIFIKTEQVGDSINVYLSIEEVV